MPAEVDAIYHAGNSAHPNPLRDALPPPLDRDAVLENLKKLPPYSDDERALQPDEKFCRLDRILEVFYPLTYYINLQRAVDRAMRNSYEHRNPLNPGFYRNVVNASQSISQFSVPAGMSKADCPGFAIAGDSGIGKSSATKRTLELTPRLINHSSFNGTRFPFRQVPWIKVDCPPDGSTRALCVKVLEAYDSVLSTEYVSLYDRKGVNANKLMSHIERVACFHGTGVAVIDEIQNLAFAPSGGADQVLAFFSVLMHCFGLPVILIGTIDAVRLLSSRFSQARRATGYCNPIWTRILKDEPDWNILLRALWRYQYTAVRTTLTPEIDDAMYDSTQGIADNVAKLYRAIQEKLIYRQKEKQEITPKVIRETAATFFGLQKDHLRYISGAADLVPLEPDRRDGNNIGRDYQLPNELAMVKKAHLQFDSVYNPRTIPPAETLSTAASSLTKDGGYTQLNPPKKTVKSKAKRAPHPVFEAHKASETSGQPISNLLVETGFAVKTSELL